MKRILIAAACAALAGCASLEPAPSLPMPPAARNPEFSPIFAQMYQQQQTYDAMAKRLVGESAFLDGFSLTAQVATLGFAAYKAHPDNTTAAAITAGVSGAARDRLNPRALALFYRHGSTALSCVADYANLLTYIAPASAAPVSTAAVRANALNPTTLTYAAIQVELRKTLTEAAEIAQPSPELKAAVTAAQGADQHLTLGIEAQSQALAEIIGAKNAIHAAVEKRQLPDLKSLLDDITKIKIPAPPTASSTGSGKAAATMLTLQSKGAKGLAQLKAMVDAEAISDKDIAQRLKALADFVQMLHPEKDAEAISKMKLCVVTFDPPPKP